MKFTEKVDQLLSQFEEKKKKGQKGEEELKELLENLLSRADAKKLGVVLTADESSIMILPGGNLKLAKEVFKKGESINWGDFYSVEEIIKKGEHWGEYSLFACLLRKALNDPEEVDVYFIEKIDLPTEWF